MPLVEKTRIEFFFPDSADPAYPETINRFENELTQTCGGCSVIQGTKGLYRSDNRGVMQDRIDLLFVDVALKLDFDRATIDRYVDTLAKIISDALDEEKVLITVHTIYHQTSS